MLIYVRVLGSNPRPLSRPCSEQEALLVKQTGSVWIRRGNASAWDRRGRQEAFLKAWLTLRAIGSPLSSAIFCPSDVSSLICSLSISICFRACDGRREVEDALPRYAASGQSEHPDARSAERRLSLNQQPGRTVKRAWSVRSTSSIRSSACRSARLSGTSRPSISSVAE